MQISLFRARKYLHIFYPRLVAEQALMSVHVDEAGRERKIVAMPGTSDVVLTKFCMSICKDVLRNLVSYMACNIDTTIHISQHLSA